MNRGVEEQFDAFFGQEHEDHHRGVHWGVVPVEEPLPLQSKMAVQDATDGDQWWAAILKNVSFKAIQIPNF